MNDNSIHPRVRAGTKKVNTCKSPKNPKRGKLGKNLKRLETRQQARAMTIASVSSSLKENAELAFRRPGSMKK